MPIVKIHRKGVPNEELIAIIKTNVRIPERAMGDFPPARRGEPASSDLWICSKYGREAVSRNRSDHGPKRGGGA